MKKIKLTFPYPNFPLLKQTQDQQGRWGDYQFFINEDVPNCDYWVVYDSLLTKQEQSFCSPNHLIFISAEPPSVNDYNPRFLKQFAQVITCQQSLRHPNLTFTLQGQPWHVGLARQHQSTDINKSYAELTALTVVPKTKNLSLIVSNKQFTAGHKKRYHFALALKKYFGDDIDLFGRGINDFDDKWEVLAPYRYSLAIENSSYPDYITEKLCDCYLAHTFPLYHGAPNINKYFPRAAYELIDINNLEASIAVIKKLLDSQDYYQDHLPAILEAKDLCLNKYNLFPLIVDFIEKHPDGGTSRREVIELKQRFFSFKRIMLRLLINIKKFYVQNF